MKPWEGQHWIKFREESTDFYSRNIVKWAEDALKEDWEQQQKEALCAQTAEKEKSGHQNSYKELLKP